jgi:serine/threonine protein kinase/Tol biopolymer transport system component
MSLTSGTKLGPYEIQSPLGAGGMGEVYRARDSRLNRDVAIKVLPTIFAHDAERMGRFQREAQLLASLNHPNIASIYGLEEKDSVRALVMELVEGPTLAMRIGSGSIPIEETLPIARQIAEALESAHEKGIIHRDLKPANIKLTPDGTVKVLDFGLAKALDSPDSNLPDPTNSPTFTAATRIGIILGTAAYMSPEQAKGKPVDRRTDIWAFGCVLYEMLTGKPPFAGETITDTLAAVVRAEPEWGLLPKNTPVAIRELLRRCLQKDPKERLRDIGDVRIELKQLLSGSGTSVALALPEPPASLGNWARRLPWAVAAFAFLAAVVIWFASKSHTQPRPTVARFAIAMPRFDEFGEISISPDGNEIVFDTLPMGGGTGSQFYLRKLDQLTATPIAGTEQSDYPSFSLDGKWLAFIGNGRLMKVRLDSGTSQVICPAARAAGVSWADDNTIIFSQVGLGLFRVSAGGGTPELVAPIGPQTGNRDYLTPNVLPGAKFAIVTLGAAFAAPESAADIAVVRIDQPGTVPTPRILVQGARLGRFAKQGLILFTRGESLFGVPFDLAQQKTIGTPIPVLERVQVNPDQPYQYYDVSSTCTLAYSPPVGQARIPVLVNRKGEEQQLTAPVHRYWDPQLSPDGKQLALSVESAPGHQNPWIYDLERHTWMRLGFAEREDMSPVWAPDGRHLFYVTNTGGVFSKMADGSGTEQQIYKFNDPLFLTSITPDGRTISGEQLHGKLGWDIVVLHLKDDGQVDGDAVPFISTPANEWRAQFSPDGHWIAYVSNETGSWEVYVQAYPGTGGKWQVSTDGGDEPRWAGSGRELFYLHGNTMMAVDVKASPTFSSGTPHVLFAGKYETPGGVQNYAVTPDGQKFVMLKKQSDSSPPEIDVVLNWAQELQK